MIATEQSGYLFANSGGAWPGFSRFQIVVTPDGSLQLDSTGSVFRSKGAFFGGPFEALDGATPWFRVHALESSLPEGTHLQLFTFASAGVAPAVVLGSEQPFAGWHAAPADCAEFALTPEANRRLWIGGVLRSTGAATPSIGQIRVDYGRDGWTRNLPAIYRQEASSRDLLERFLALQESQLGELDHLIEALPRLFDPHAVPDQGYPSWFAWLSSWLAFEQNEHWTDAERRDYLGEAFTLYARRGTLEGLRRYIRMYAGVNATIIEPARTATVWTLGENSLLGFTTMLAPSELAGAVLSSTAVLDRSNLTPEGDHGASLFDDLAHRFCVHVWCGELTREGALADLRAVIEREKPAHTVAKLCLVHPGVRAGISIAGVSSIVGDGLPPAQIGKRLGSAGLSIEAQRVRRAPPSK